MWFGLITLQLFDYKVWFELRGNFAAKIECKHNSFILKVAPCFCFQFSFALESFSFNHKLAKWVGFLKLPPEMSYCFETKRF
jgi:hypothetical protein